jgi:hypothetical protein
MLLLPHVSTAPHSVGSPGFKVSQQKIILYYIILYYKMHGSSLDGFSTQPRYISPIKYHMGQEATVISLWREHLDLPGPGSKEVIQLSYSACVKSSPDEETISNHWLLREGTSVWSP